MRDPRTWILVLLLTILAAINLKQCGRGEPKPEESAARLEQRTGEAMANLTAQHLDGDGNIVLAAYAPDAGQAAGLVEENFKRQAEKRGLKVLETLHIGAPKRGLEDMETARLNAVSLRAVVTRFAEVDAIVSLCGEPSGRSTDLESLPPFYCLCDEEKRIPELMEAGIVRAAYVPRRSAPPSDSKEDWFSLLYELVLPENAARIHAN